MRADWIKLMIAAARLPLRNDPANNQFARLCQAWHKRAYVRSAIMLSTRQEAAPCMAA